MGGGEAAGEGVGAGRRVPSVGQGFGGGGGGGGGGGMYSLPGGGRGVVGSGSSSSGSRAVAAVGGSSSSSSSSSASAHGHPAPAAKPQTASSSKQQYLQPTAVPLLFRVAGAKFCVVKRLPCRADVVADRGVYLLWSPAGVIYVWHGADANALERVKVLAFLPNPSPKRAGVGHGAHLVGADRSSHTRS